MIDCHPIEPRIKILLHRLHQIAHEGFQISHLRGVFRRDEETELMPVAFAVFKKIFAIFFIMYSIVKLTRLALLRNTVSLDVVQMGACCPNPALLVPSSKLYNPRLDDNTSIG